MSYYFHQKNEIKTANKKNYTKKKTKENISLLFIVDRRKAFGEELSRLNAYEGF